MMFTIWGIGVGVTVALFVPLTVYLLHDLWRTVRSIEIYAREAAGPTIGVAGHMEHVAGLDDSIRIAAEVVAAAESIAAKLDVLATALSRGVEK